MYKIIAFAKGGNLSGVKAAVEEDPRAVAAVDRINGFTPLHYAAYMGHKEMAVYLIENGASVDALDVEGRMPVQLAYRALNQPLLRLLEWHTFAFVREPEPPPDPEEPSNVIPFPRRGSAPSP